MSNYNNDIVFVPLGGLGEIGMNAALYGFGPKKSRKWILIDLGVSFAGPDLVGIDLLMPDLTFIDHIRKDVLGLIITHAHEDHIGAVADLWSRLKCPVFATPFAAGLLEVRRLNEPGAPHIPFQIVEQGATLDLAPFSIEFIPVAHSIPESNALAIRTPAGLVLHTGDWKIDPTPIVGRPTDEARLRQLGQEGVLALISDSTNIMRDGESPSEADVAKTLRELVRDTQGRVVVTTFASNVARLRSVAEAAQANGRSVVLVGRAMDRVVQVARECGYLDGLPPFLSMNSYRDLPRDRIVVLATGSQGEPRAALARIAQNDHPEVRLSPHDRVIFSSRTIPGNERGVGEIINGLITQGVEVITDRTHLVHVSGHPRRAEVKRLYDWIKPHIAVPAHGEALHLHEHAQFARAQGVPFVIEARNGDIVSLSAEQPACIDQIPHGTMLKDGNILIGMRDEAIAMRQKLAFSGIVSVGIAITPKGELAGDPDVVFAGIPAKTRSGKKTDEIIDQAIFATLDTLPKARKRDPDALAESVEKTVRHCLRDEWGKRPHVHVLVMVV